jgi:hypothetical protein
MKKDEAYDKKYISVALLVLLLIIILIKGAFSSKSDSQDGTELASEVSTTESGDTLAECTDEELITLIKDYYKAYADADLEALETIAQPITDNEKSYIEAFSKYYEEFQNITCYSSPGATEDSYLVSAVYDLKFYDIETAAPGMEFFYVERDGKGNMIVNNRYSSYNISFRESDMDDDIYAMICSYEKSEGCSALQNEVQTRYDEALVSDEDLANLVGNGTLRDVVTKWHDSISSETEVASSEQNTESSEETTEAKEDDSKKSSEKADEKSSEASSEATSESSETTDTGKVKTKDICKVRKGPGTDYEVLGMVTAGVKLKKLGTEGDWTKVEFQGSTGYIKSSLLKTVKKKN